MRTRREVATLLGISIRAVKSAEERGMRKLRKYFKENPGRAKAIKALTVEEPERPTLDSKTGRGFC